MTKDMAYWIPLAVLYLIKGGACLCTYPGDEADSTLVAETSQTTYSEGDMILYACERAGGGHVTRFCKADNTWTDASRSCAESIIFDTGALAGVVVAGFNYFIAIFFIIYSRCKFPKLADAEEAEDKNKEYKDKEAAAKEKEKKEKDKKQEPVTSNGTK